MVRRLFAAALVALAGLSAPAGAQQQDLSASLAQDLSSCAGAVAAVGNLEVLTYPNGASGAWAPVLGRILERLRTEPGLEGMTGRYAASAARSFWAEQPRAQRERTANACRDRFAAD
jgi:hypothetical protein